MGIREKYREQIGKSALRGEAPSGQVFAYRGLNLFQLTVADSLPLLGTGKVEDATISPDANKAYEEHFIRTVIDCTLSPRLVIEEDPNYPDAIPLAEIDRADLLWLYLQIQGASGLNSPLAEQARSFRDERDRLRPASRNGEGHGGEAEPDVGDRPRGVAGPRRRVRPHGVGQGAAVGARAAEAVRGGPEAR